jgi:hypothetical protein
VIGPIGFDNVEVMRVGVNGSGGANTLFIVCGVALVEFNGNQDDWRRDDLTFLVPDEGGGTLNVGAFQDSVTVAFPATVENTDDTPVGWGVDTVDTIVEGNNVRLTARVVVRQKGGHFLRMGFQVNILGTSRQ